MQTQVSIKDKKNFIRWFLKNYQLKIRESVWILNYLLSHESTLAHVHFVQNVTKSPRGIAMTTICSEESPFRFNKKQVVTTDADKSFHDIRLNHDSPLYIQLNFKESFKSAYYVGVVEENPYLSENHDITNEDRQIAQELLNRLLNDCKIKKYKEYINEALDKHNLEEFMKWSSELNQLVNQEKINLFY